MSRSKVQMSTTSSAVPGSPSTTLPAPSRTTLTCSLVKRTRDARVGALHAGLDHIGGADRDQLGLERLARSPALVDRAGEAVEDGVGEQRPERVLVARAVGLDDHLEGAARAAEEVAQIEARVGLADLGQPGLDVAVGEIGDAGLGFRRRTGPIRQGDDVVRRAIAAAGVAEAAGTPPLLTGAPAEHAAQAQSDERRNHGEEQDIEVGKALRHSGSIDARVAAAGDFADGARRSSWRKLRTRC